MADVPKTPGSVTPTQASPPPKIGSYRLVEQLGSGGMSSVFRAIHEETGHEVAVKVLPRYLAKNSTLLQRFLREAKSAEALEDPHVVAIYDRGSESGRYYLVLEYVPGGDLHDRVRDGGPLPLADALHVIQDVARGLRHAASRGLIHRDIKPANLLMTADGRVKITDLGLALQVEDEDERVTRDGTTVGTVDYMAPEQGRDSRAATLKSDVYSLGCTFYYLLTGMPPFTGGDVAEKLRRHANEPPPDVRKLRPEVPEPLARLIQKMMAKKPNTRFADYDGLLETLDAVAVLIDGRPAEQPLDALIDDEDDGPLVLDALIDDEDQGQPLDALIDDEDDDIGFRLGTGTLGDPEEEGPASTIDAPPVRSKSSDFPLTLTGPSSSATRPARRDESPPPPELTMADLARLDAEAAPRRPAPTKRPSSHGVIPRPPDEGPPLPTLAREPEPASPPTAPIISRSEAAELQSLIIKGVLVGAVVVALAIGGYQLWINPGNGGEVAQGSDEGGAENGGAVEPKPPAPRTGGSGRQPTSPVARGNANTALLVAKNYIEPTDPARDRVSGPSYPDTTVKQLFPGGIEEHSNQSGGSTTYVVRRVAGPGEYSALPRALFDKPDGVVELADDGPFFENDFRVSGKDRTVRAKSGLRPVLVVVGRPERQAVIDLENKRLVLEGIDLVVPLENLSGKTESIFHLRRGAELVLRDCTITIVGGPNSSGRDVVQLGERAAVAQAGSRLRLERTLVRGPAKAGIRASGPAEITLAESILLVQNGPAVVASGEANADRRVNAYLSIVAASGPLLLLDGSAAAPGAKAVAVRALGCSFGSLDGKSPLIAKLNEPRNPSGPPRPVVDWEGDRNAFHGWTAWFLASGSRGAIRDLADARKTWPRTDISSLEISHHWPASLADAWSLPDALAAHATEPAAKAILAQVAQPAVLLKEKTLGRFEPEAVAENVVPSGMIEFDLISPQWNGDLGKFLDAKLKAGAKNLRVVVKGGGDQLMTPVVLPDGVSVDIEIKPLPDQPISFRQQPGASGPGLFVVRNSELTLRGARFHREGSAGLQSLIHVDGGRLSLMNCWLTAPSEVDPTGGELIAFRTNGTHPGPGHQGTSASTAPEPASVSLVNCVLMTGGAAVVADVGRGVVALKNCAVAAGRVAFVLNPLKVARSAFAADLRLERCTILAEHDFVRFGRWPGADPGPDRPWLISTASCAFLDDYDRSGGSSKSVLLRTEAGGMEHGALAWQSYGDAFGVSIFALPATAQVAAVSGRPDLEHQWIELWVPQAIRGATGPRLSRTDTAARLLKPQPPGKLEPVDLALDPKFPAGVGPRVGADHESLGIKVPTGRSRR